jgi:glycosyltransferase involved in cell wall biosynthesis
MKGKVSYEALPTYHRASDIFVSPATGAESFGIVLVEAMAAGLPVVSTDVGDVSAMVARSNRPYVVAPDRLSDFRAALGKLVADPALRAKIGEANRKRALKCFDEAVMFQLYGELYGEAIGDELALI